MNLTYRYVGAFTLAMAASLFAQSDPGAQIVTVGCVNRALQTGSLAPSPGVPAAAPGGAEYLANSSEPTRNFLLAGATPADATAEMRAKAAAGEPVSTSSVTYVLDGAREDVERNIGHLVEVTGMLRTVSEGDQANRQNVKHVAVTSIKMLAATCPGPAAGTPNSR